mmetsp:Transcript_36925/g.92548  ORF Transcript_36925/g.92548 Transcript_36925/m.92548 type:complete len:228 (-) Transcript_36925:1294-1977(-)
MRLRLRLRPPPPRRLLPALSRPPLAGRASSLQPRCWTTPVSPAGCSHTGAPSREALLRRASASPCVVGRATWCCTAARAPTARPCPTRASISWTQDAPPGSRSSAVLDRRPASTTARWCSATGCWCSAAELVPATSTISGPSTYSTTSGRRCPPHSPARTARVPDPIHTRRMHRWPSSRRLPPVSQQLRPPASDTLRCRCPRLLWAVAAKQKKKKKVFSSSADTTAP